MTSDAPADRHWMRLALAEARRAEGQTRPNPPVGAVLVREGRLLASGFHRAAGLPHAEVEVLRAAAPAFAAAGATLYVTLEPCSTQGRTPPCTAAILAAGLRRVVVGALDPNPRHGGRGITLLRDAGVEVRTGVLKREATDLIAPFAAWILRKRPWVTLKMAQSLDGAIADAEGRSQWISAPQALAQVQAFRRCADAVLVGVGTVLADNPSLLCRLPEAPPTLFRVVVDSRGRTPLSARLLTDGQAARTVMATTAACPPTVQAAWQTAGARVWMLPADAHGRVALDALLDRAGVEGWLRLLCEGGATLAGALLQAGLVDELQLMVAPIVLGARTASTFGALPFALDSAPRFSLRSQRRLGPDLWITATR